MSVAFNKNCHISFLIYLNHLTRVTLLRLFRLPVFKAKNHTLSLNLALKKDFLFPLIRNTIIQRSTFMKLSAIPETDSESKATAAGTTCLR